MAVKDLRHAYAVLELTPPVDEASLKRQHKLLVRRWHPDRFQQDPAGQAEATITLRTINLAYEVVLASLGSAEPEPVTEAPPVAPAADRPISYTDGGFSLSREQVDAIVDSMNRKNRMFSESSAFERWLSAGVVLAYMAAAGILVALDPPAPHRGGQRGSGGVLGLLAFYLILPLRLIWIDGANEDRDSVTRNTIRVLAWTFMSAPAILTLYWWISG